MKKLYTCIFLIIQLFSQNSLFSQNELYNNGGLITINTGSASATPTLYVNGNVTNQDGIINNKASNFRIENGNFANNTSTYYYESTGIEEFTGTTNNMISGTWNGTTLNRNQFYDLKINKNSTTGEYVILGTTIGNTVNINPTGTLTFTSTNGIIRTQTTSGASTGDYTNTLYIQNPSTTAISGHSTGSGATTKYIEGKLIRQVNSSGTYFFPVGVYKTDLDGMEALSVTMNSLSMASGTTTGLLAYLKPASTSLITNGDILFYDIGYFTSPTQNNFSQCASGPDGHDDVAVIDQAITHEWMVTPNVAPSSVNYNLTVYPGSVLDNLNYSIMGSPCNNTYQKAQYLARDGRIGGNVAVGPTINYWVPGVTGLYMYPTMKTLVNQNGFSSFRIWGASDNNTSLPIELLSFTITPVNNQYFVLDWKTASEINNAGFYIQRSRDNNTFENIGWISGHGTTTAQQSYSFTDRDVEVNTTYYYRLQQMDIDHTISYSNTLSGILIGNSFNILSIQPNPTNINPLVNLYMPNDGTLQTTILDILGREVGNQNFNLTKGNNTVTLDINTLAKATYLLKFNVNNNIITKKIIKN